MPNCAVALCPNYTRKNRKIEVSFHKFPKDAKLQKEWIVKCKRSDKINLMHATICSEHFATEDFVLDYKSELLGVKSKRRLKENVIPSLHLPTSHVVGNAKSHPRRVLKRHMSETLNDTSEAKIAKLMTLSPLPMNFSTADICSSDVASEAEKLKKLQEENSLLLNRITQLEKEIQILNSANKTSQLNYRILKSKYECLEKKVKLKNDNAIKHALKPYFTQGQIIRIMKNKKVPWTDEDISNALALRSVSRKTYLFLKSKMNWPLPSISCLKLWTKNFHCHPGILKSILSVMQEKSKTLDAFEKCCVILFDEMNIDAKYAYDHREDQVFGSHKNAQVVMIRGLFKPWKQPIYFNFDQQITFPLLKEIIIVVEKAGFEVLAIVSDMGGGNRGLWRDLNISENSTSFINPADPQREIFVFADIPHLIKLLRNHLFDQGLILSSGDVVSKEMLQFIINANQTEINITPKISSKHIEVKGNQRQNVRLAVQVFSHTVATALLKFFPDKKYIGIFFELVNNFFDVMNSSTKINKSTPLKSAFGLKEEAQLEILNKMEKEINLLKIRGSKRKILYPFQVGFLVSIKSIKNLYEYLKSRGIKYILTSKVNQDALENFFSQLRAAGNTYDHPSPVEFKNRLRLIILGNKMPQISSGASVSQSEDNQMLSSAMFRFLNDEDKDVNQHFEENEMYQFFDKTDPTSVESEGLRFIAGFVAHKADKSLGEIASCEEDKGWIEALTRGGLMKPNEEFSQEIKIWDETFIEMHGDSISKDKGVIAKLIDKITFISPSISKNAIKLFCRTRTFIRIKHLNKQIDKKIMERKSKNKNIKWVKST